MKLPVNYVPGVGVKKASGFGGIGQKLMEKQGWQKGQGLGKDGAGMAEALELKEKKDTLGVGAAGGWDWSAKFWEDAYNSAAKVIQHGSDSSTTTSTSVAASDRSSDSSSSSSSDDEAASKRTAGKRKSPDTSNKKTAAKKKQVSSDADASDASSSDSDASSDSDVEVKASAKKGKKSKKGKSESESKDDAVAKNRDGTFASASAAELAIAAELAKDPWGRWGGKAGKMARIRQQEEEEAARMRAKLGLDPLPPRRTSEAGKKLGGNSKEAALKAQKDAEAEKPKKERIVVTLTIPEDQKIQKAAFVPTPKTGWWGAGYYVSAGALESMEEAGEHVAKERKTFNEDDQANLYMLAHLNKRDGTKGLGKSTTVNIAGGKWEGSKKTFDEEEQGQDSDKAPKAIPVLDYQLDEGNDNNVTAQAAEVPVKKEKKSKKQKKSDEQDTVQAAAAAADDDSSSKKKKKQKGSKSVEDQTAAVSTGDATDGGEQSEHATKGVKWLKLAKVMLKDAPKRRLKLEKLIKKLLVQAEELHQKETEEHAKTHGKKKGHSSHHHSMKKSYSHEDISNVLHKKAKQSKVIIEGGYVKLPV